MKKRIDASIEKLIAFRKRGLSNQEIGNLYGVEAKYVSIAFCAYKRKCKAAGIECEIGRSPKPPRKNKPKEDYMKVMQKVAALLANGYSVPQAAKQVGCAIDYVYRYLPTYQEQVLAGEIKDDKVKDYFIRQQLEGLDYGKLGALKRAGWTDKEIAEDLGIAVCVVQIAQERKINLPFQPCKSKLGFRKEGAIW